jgi:hypothetical protein
LNGPTASRWKTEFIGLIFHCTSEEERYVGRPVDVIGQRDEKGVNPSVSHSADSPEAVCQNERARGDTSQLPDAGKFENMRWIGQRKLPGAILDMTKTYQRDISDSHREGAK